jgi:hypothetical protein
MAKTSNRLPLAGFQKGTVHIAPGADLTDPAAPYWGLDLTGFKDLRCGSRTSAWHIERARRAVVGCKGRLEQGACARPKRRRRGRRVGARLSAPRTRYWYARTGRSPASGPVEIEWDAIVEALLAKAE